MRLLVLFIRNLMTVFGLIIIVTGFLFLATKYTIPTVIGLLFGCTFLVTFLDYEAEK